MNKYLTLLGYSVIPLAVVSGCSSAPKAPKPTGDMIAVNQSIPVEIANSIHPVQPIKPAPVINKPAKVEVGGIDEFDALIQFAAGDARKALNLLDLIASTFEPEQDNHINNALVVRVAQQNIARYDKSGEQHYDLVSAFIKSIRGSDPDAALYWMARMLKGGEDPLFIARRMLIAASEDIGNSNPNALLLAGECFRSVQVIGMPEARILLGQCAVYLATSAKSNSTYLAINRAMELAEKTANLSVPLHLRNAPTKLMKQQGYGVDYLYPHDYPEHFVTQDYLPPELKGTKLYESARNKREVEGERLQQRRWQQEQQQQ